jgi:hypothetical protein
MYMDISSGLENSNVVNPRGSQARQYLSESTSESAGTQPEWSSVWSNRLVVLQDVAC